VINNCSRFQDMIPKAMLGDLRPDDQQELEHHLAECHPCARERDLYSETFRQLRLADDIATTRHFFVYPEERCQSPWRLFRLMPIGWQGAVAALVLALGVFSAISAAKLRIHAEDGAFILSFGGPIQAKTTPEFRPPLDTADLEGRILRRVEEKSREQHLEWIRMLRGEAARMEGKLNQQQRLALANGLASLERRFDNRIEATAQSLEDRNDRSLATLYKAVTLQQQRDMIAIDDRISRLAVSGEIRSSQTDEILETLLQVADLNKSK
jgi:hypothetical protein